MSLKRHFRFLNRPFGFNVRKEMGFFDSFSRKRVCPRCRHKGARQFMWRIKCPNMACSFYDPSLRIDPADLSGSYQDYQAYKGVFYSKPKRNLLTGKIIQAGKPLPQDFDPGSHSITLKYKNYRGNVREYIGDKRTLRTKGNFVSIRLAPTGQRVTFKKRFIENLSELSTGVPSDKTVEERPVPSAKERQVLGYHRKHGTTSALYETIRHKYPDWEGESSETIVSADLTDKEGQTPGSHKRRKSAGRVLLVPVGIVMVLMVGLTIFRWHDIKGGYLIDRHSLSTAVGTIVVSKIYEKGSACHYLIRYEFNVDGRPYRSEKVTFSHTGAKDRGFAMAYVRKYPVGRKVTVYYEQNNPSFSALEPDVKDSGLIIILLIMFFTAGIFLWGLARRMMRRKMETDR